MGSSYLYVLIDHPKYNKMLEMRWPAFDKKFKWDEWGDSKNMLEDWGLNPDDVKEVDSIYAEYTVGQTIELSGGDFLLFNRLVDGTYCKNKNMDKSFWDVGHSIKDDPDHGDAIIACAGWALLKNRISFETFQIVCDLHQSFVSFQDILPPELYDRYISCDVRPGIFPQYLSTTVGCGGFAGLGVEDTKRFFDFIIQAWEGRWRLICKDPTETNRKTIRTSPGAKWLYERAKKCPFAKPAIYLIYYP